MNRKQRTKSQIWIAWVCIALLVCLIPEVALGQEEDFMPGDREALWAEETPGLEGEEVPGSEEETSGDEGVLETPEVEEEEDGESDGVEGEADALEEEPEAEAMEEAAEAMLELTAEGKRIASGMLHTMAVMDDGTVWTWGWNYYGQLGDGTKGDNAVPTPVEGLSGVVSVAAGDDTLS